MVLIRVKERFIMNKNNVDKYYMSTHEVLAVYKVTNKQQLKTDHNLTITRKSKRIDGKVCKVYIVSTLDNPQDTAPSCSKENNIASNGDLISFGSKLRTALGIIYTDELVRVNWQEFGYSYDIVIGDYDLVIAYNRVYKVEELRPIMDKHKDYEINHGQNCTGEKIRFDTVGKLVSDLGSSRFYVASVTPDNADLFIYRLLLDLGCENSDREIYLNRIGYMYKIQDDPNLDYGGPQANGDMPTPWEIVEFDFNEYLYPSSIIGSGLVSSNLLFGDNITKEQAEMQSSRAIDTLMARFGATSKHADQLAEETKAIKEAVYTVYDTKSIKTLAKRIAENPTKLAMVQAQIEKQGNQQWRDVNTLLKAIGLTAWVDTNGMVSIGIYGEMVATRQGKFTMHQRQVTWLEPKPQNSTLELCFKS